MQIEGSREIHKAIILVHPFSRATSSLSCNPSKKNFTNNTQLYTITIKNTSCTLQDHKTPLNNRTNTLQPQIFRIQQC